MGKRGCSGATLFGFLLAVTSTGPALADAGSDGAPIGVAASSVSDVTVIWSGQRIRRLEDMRPVLEGKEEVAGVTVGPDGTVYAIRGEDSFGVAPPGGEEVWQHAPTSGETRRLQMLGSWVAWLVWERDKGAVLLLTRDQGHTWTRQELPGIDDGKFRLRPDGTLELVAVFYDCHSGDYARLYTGRLGSRRWKRVPWPYGPHDVESSSLGHDGTAYAFPTATGRRWTYAIDWNAHPRRLLRLTGGKRVTVEDSSPDDIVLMTVDHHGRPLGVAGHEVWLWSPEQHWQKLAAP